MERYTDGNALAGPLREIFAVELPRTSWSETHGQPADRSNHRSLIRDSDGLGKDLPAFRSAASSTRRDCWANAVQPIRTSPQSAPPAATARPERG